MIDLTRLEPSEAERIAYAEGFHMAAQLFARIADLEAQLTELQAKMDDIEPFTDDVATELHQYRQFFSDCFDRLAGVYPAPSVTSDYDKSVIFDAIEKGESM